MNTTSNILDGLKTKHSDLKTKLVDVMADMNRVKDQIGRAKARAASTGDYSDTKWYRAANAALNHLKTEHQTVLLQLSDIKAQIVAEEKQQNKLAGQTFERLFIKTAQRVLPAEQYRQLLTLTHLEFDSVRPENAVHDNH